MIDVFGGSGFVGRHLVQSLDESSVFVHPRNSATAIKGQTVVHLSGIAHDVAGSVNAAEYYRVNTELAKRIFDRFLASDARTFITLSSVKAVAEEAAVALTEDSVPSPETDYGKSKLLAEEYILERSSSANKRVYVLRPCMIHGPGNRGNLPHLYDMLRVGIPWPLGAYSNLRSFTSIKNLCFVIKELHERDDIPSGIYNVADDDPISVNDLVRLIAESQGRSPRILRVPRRWIAIAAALGDHLPLPLNSRRLRRLTEDYVVSNKKLMSKLRKPLPQSAREGLRVTLQSLAGAARAR